MPIETIASKLIYPDMSGVRSVIEGEMQPVSEQVLGYRSANNLLAIYANEVLPSIDYDTSAGMPAEMDILIKGRRVTLIKPEIIAPGLVRRFDQALLRTDSNMFAPLTPDDVFELLGVNQQGKDWLKNHVENWHDKLQSDQLTNSIDWESLMQQVEGGVISPAIFYSIVEQYNPSYERWYHPLAFTQLGDSSYSAYLARLLRKDPEYPQLGSYNLITVSHVPGTEVASSKFSKGKREDSTTVYIHPQNMSYITDERIITGNLDHSIRYMPGATIRTGFMIREGQNLDEDTPVIKLSYEPKVTSRSRRIPWAEHAHAIQMNNLLTALIDRGDLEGITLWPDVYTVRLGTDDRISYRIRGSLNELYPHLQKDILVFPSFGLYYYSEIVQTPLIKTLIDRSGMVPQEFLFKQVLTPLIHGYFDLAIKHGIIHEPHGQNVLFAYSLKTGDMSIIIKDIESCIINAAKKEQYSSWIDPVAEDINRISIEIFSAPKDMKDKVSKRFSHWLMRVHVEPILDTISIGYDIPKEELYVIVKNVITNWWIQNGRNFEDMENEFDIERYFVRNYLYTNKMLSEEVMAYNVYQTIPFMYRRDEVKKIIEDGIHLEWNQRFIS